MLHMLCAIFLAGSLNTSALPGSNAGKVTVTGSVATQDGEPLAQARAELLPILNGFEAGQLILAGHLEPPAVATATTDAEGRFELGVPRNGVWKVVVTAAEYIPMQLPYVALVASRELAPVALAPDRGARVRVIDATHQPRAHAWVWAESANPGPGTGRESGGLTSVPVSRTPRGGSFYREPTVSSSKSTYSTATAFR